MFTELYGLLSSMDVKQKTDASGNKNIIFRNKHNNIRSISAYSSNSIFYFPTIVSDQCTAEEQAMVMRMIEKAYASFVVACISLMPFHRIKADDKASIEDYLSQFHQNLGMGPSAGNIIASQVFANNTTVGRVTLTNESAEDAQAIRETEDFLLNCWNRSLQENTDFLQIVSETVSVNDMFSIDPVDPKTKVLQEQFMKTQEELELWGFIGEATDTMLDDLPDEDFSKYFDPKYGEGDDDLEDLDDEDDLEDIDIEGLDLDLTEAVVVGEKGGKKKTIHNKKAIDTIMFSLESVSDNKIQSCSSLTKLSKLEGKLNKLKNKYTKYLNRYKKKYKENKENNTKSKLTIRFNKMTISDPKAFMKTYGEYIKVINHKLKLVEQRRAELRNRKGLPPVEEKLEENAITDLTSMDFETLDNCLATIDECINAPDSEIFSYEAIVESTTEDDLIDPEFIDEATTPKKYKDYMRQQTQAHHQEMYQSELKNRQLQKQIDDMNAKNSATRANNAAKPFDKAVFTDMDMKKANEAIPLFTNAQISFIVDDTNEVISRNVLIGVKAYIHTAPAKELINDVYNCVINRRKFLRFVKFISGEEKSLTDLLFGFKELRADALDAKGAGEWRAAFKRRHRWSKMSVPYIMKSYTPNGTLVMTMNEVNFIKDQYGVDIMNPDHVRMIMDADYLLGFVVIDQAEEMVHVIYDGHGYGFQQYTYSMLNREAAITNNELTKIYRNFSTMR